MNNFSDDKTIPDNEELYRRIHPKQMRYVEEAKTYRVSSAAFKTHRDYPNEISIDLSSLSTPEESIARVSQQDVKYALASVTAADVRSLKQGVVRSPIDNNIAHGLIFGQITESVSKTLSRSAKWVISPQMPEA